MLLVFQFIVLSMLTPRYLSSSTVSTCTGRQKNNQHHYIICSLTLHIRKITFLVLNLVLVIYAELPQSHHRQVAWDHGKLQDQHIYAEESGKGKYSTKLIWEFRKCGTGYSVMLLTLRSFVSIGIFPEIPLPNLFIAHLKFHVPRKSIAIVSKCEDDT